MAGRCRCAPNLAARDQDKVRLGNKLMQLTVDLVGLAHTADVGWSIENPLGSYLWAMPPVQRLAKFTNVSRTEFDMCRFGSAHLKPTALLSNTSLQALGKRCDRDRRPHVHDPLVGFAVVEGERVFKTRLAQVYPWQLCEAWAQIILGVESDPLSATFAMKVPAAHRKRPVGQPLPWKDHRQRDTGERAIAAGYQLKKSAVPPLLPCEFEPGEAVRFALDLAHPFSIAPDLEPDLQEALSFVAHQPGRLLAHRLKAVAHWEARAIALLPETERILASVHDPWLRKLLRGAPDEEPIALGAVTHIALWREMAHAALSIDAALVDEMLTGMTIVGPISAAGRWPAFDKDQRTLPLEQLRQRAWEFSRKVNNNIAKCEVTENTQKVWDSTIEDVKDGVTLGPFFDKREVSSIVGDPWIPTQRFEVVQKNKVRGVDSATVNGVNQATVITEKLVLPSTDVNVAALRWLRSNVHAEELRGWVLDERKAYRQVPVHPAHRRWSVVAMKEPLSGKIAYFVMIGHSFGLVAAVYNYNRRSALITDVLRRLFLVAAFNFYDDKYGFETKRTIDSAFGIAQSVHTWLGAKFDPKKLQLTSSPTILGITYDLCKLRLLIKAERKAELIEEIESILSNQVLSPGQAGKLRGKLMFGSSQLWGKIGRAFLRALSERQYSSAARSSLNSALKAALEEWKFLISKGPPRPIEEARIRKADFVVFTDGSFPEGKIDSLDFPWIGGVVFARGKQPLQFGARVPDQLIDTWLPRKSQIAMVELFAVIVALQTFRDLLRGTWILVFVDSEPVQGALVKGYSAREDFCSLVSVFWRLALELRVLAYIDRVPTDSNPADPPSRNLMDVGHLLGWKTVPAEFPELGQRGVSSSC